MAEIDFLGALHNRTPRDYVGRVVADDKAECAAVAKRWGYDYWDGERRYGYGGYRYDGRWRPVAERIANHYGLKAGDRVLDIGCGKGFLLYELSQAVPGLEVTGVDLSEYALEHAKEELKPHLERADAVALPFADDSFDFVYSLNVFHNLRLFDLFRALGEMERVGRGRAYLAVESYRNEREKANLLYWQLTCESFFDPDEWSWIRERAGYRGDWGYIFFE